MLEKQVKNDGYSNISSIIYVIHNSSRPESFLRRTSNSVCNHTVFESVAMGESLVGHIPSKVNIADLLTKVLHGRKKRYSVSSILYGIHQDYQSSAVNIN